MVEISLIQLHIDDTFSDNSSEMCHEAKFPGMTMSIMKVPMMKMIQRSKRMCQRSHYFSPFKVVSGGEG